MDKGLIVGAHWDIDSASKSDNQVTPSVEGAFPPAELSLFQSINPNGTIPTFLFGCKYYRVGNAYETQNDADAEAGEFKAVINKLLDDLKSPTGNSSSSPPVA